MLNNLAKDDKVIAVTFLENENGEWEDHNYWSACIDAQISAANKGASVERIFITNETKLDNALQTLRVAKIHTEEQFEETKLIGYFMDKKSYWNLSSDAKRKIRQGFILINSKSTNERMAVIDHFDNKNSEENDDQKNLDYRTDVIFDVDELNQIEIYFDKMKYNLPLLSMKHYCTKDCHTENDLLKMEA